ncbi:hypothetical protein B0H14DRAFT_2611075 [Mycena olivaceomarginata]|nr:hypothetical protein B0H14DRAFT_2611075 [Mycena olivaceomarginata]
MYARTIDYSPILLNQDPALLKTAGPHSQPLTFTGYVKIKRGPSRRAYLMHASLRLFLTGYPTNNGQTCWRRPTTAGTDRCTARLQDVRTNDSGTSNVFDPTKMQRRLATRAFESEEVRLPRVAVVLIDAHSLLICEFKYKNERIALYCDLTSNSSLGTAPDGETADFGSFLSAEESSGI